jgi:hypothetical protein
LFVEGNLRRWRAVVLDLSRRASARC